MIQVYEIDKKGVDTGLEAVHFLPRRAIIAQGWEV
jgi:hypothetical protein